MALMYRGARAQPRAGFQLLSWYFFRLSGAALLLLALGHLFFTHYLNTPSATGWDFVSGRWVGPFWRTFDWLLLSLALVHGLNGVQLSVDDYIHKRQIRLAATTVLIILGYGFLALGTLTILVFSPTMARQAQAVGEPFWIAGVLDTLLYALAVGTYVGGVVLVLWLVREYRAGRLYLGGWGMLAWLMHRVTGLGVIGFLLIHIVSIMLVNVSPAVYDETVRAYGAPFLFPMEIALVGAVVFHAMNGCRIIAFDISNGAMLKQQTLFAAALGLTIVLTLPAVIRLLVP
jgi:succinate dehydrogenase / fumarate reductase, membrane anchor subunit